MQNSSAGDDGDDGVVITQPQLTEQNVLFDDSEELDKAAGGARNNDYADDEEDDEEEDDDDDDEAGVMRWQRARTPTRTNFRSTQLEQDVRMPSSATQMPPPPQHAQQQQQEQQQQQKQQSSSQPSPASQHEQQEPPPPSSSPPPPPPLSSPHLPPPSPQPAPKKKARKTAMQRAVDPSAPPLRRVQQILTLSAVPTSLPGRETERAAIQTHLTTAMRARRNCSVYLSGLPGTGKTATVHEVIRRLRALVDARDLRAFQFFELNALKLSTPEHFYVVLWKKLSGQLVVNPQHALMYLNQHFRRQTEAAEEAEDDDEDEDEDEDDDAAERRGRRKKAPVRKRRSKKPKKKRKTTTKTKEDGSDETYEDDEDDEEEEEKDDDDDDDDDDDGDRRRHRRRRRMTGKFNSSVSTDYCVVLADELDELVAAKASVMFNLFEWVWESGGRVPLAVVGVSNRVGLLDDVSNKIESRLSSTLKLQFKPYTRTQLEDIIRSRICQVVDDAHVLFDADAINLAARKIAFLNGDARRAIEICRKAAAKVDAENTGAATATATSKATTTTTTAATTTTLVTVRHIGDVIADMFNSVPTRVLASFPLHYQLFALALVRESFVTESDEVVLLHALERLRLSLGALVDAQLLDDVPPAPFDVYEEAVQQFARCGLISVRGAQLGVDAVLRLNVDLDAITYALSGKDRPKCCNYIIEKWGA